MPTVKPILDSLTPGAPWSPELTVSLHAHNSERHIRKTIDSILAQNDVRLEVIVVDDSSTDSTSLVVSSLQDPRIKLLRTEQARGAAYCHALALKLSRAPFIAQVAAEDLLLAGVLRKLLQICRGDPRIGMVRCFSFEIDENGEITREAFRLRRQQVISANASSLHHQSKNVTSGNNLIDSVRLYDKNALKQVMANDAELKPASAQEIELRISQLFSVKVLPEFLYARRVVGFPAHPTRFGHNGSLPGSPPQSAARINPGLVRQAKRAAGRILRQAWMRVFGAAYKVVFTHLSWWPIGSFLTRPVRNREKKKIAYYIWHFPVLSQTFVNRELAALKESGLSIEIVADGAENIELADENAKLLLENTFYLEPPPRGLLRTHGKAFLRKNPLLFLNLLFFVVTRRHGRHKSFNDDLYLFARAVHLAHFLKERQIDHIHTPWADQTAFIALVAAKLVGITYSAQARAHDVHRKSYLYELREKFEQAEFVVTNTRYNQSYLQSLVAKPHREKIELVYNGIDLNEFKPCRESAKRSTPVRLLCVARLIEQKGFPYLLEALRTLKQAGLDFRCEVVGGPEQPLYTNYLIQLKRLHRRLQLEDYVFFLGAQPFKIVMEKYAAADIFVLPCVIAKDGSRDITPNSLIEAMAMKLPVISTDVTGIPEIVEDGISGLLVRPNDADALATAIEKLCQDPELRIRLGEAGRKRIEDRFDIKRNTEKRVGLFEKVLASP